LSVDNLDSLGVLVHRLARAMALDMARRLRVHDVTLSQWLVLKRLWQQEGRSQVELQDLLGLDRATVAGLVQRMTNLGLIVRRADPNDKRIQRVFLTERGSALREVTLSLEQEVNADALKGFSDDERLFMLRLLARALRNCEDK
jgi:DNA-binding MarR family transcriptional regulator